MTAKEASSRGLASLGDKRGGSSLVITLVHQTASVKKGVAAMAVGAGIAKKLASIEKSKIKHVFRTIALLTLLEFKMN